MSDLEAILRHETVEAVVEEPAAEPEVEPEVVDEPEKVVEEPKAKTDDGKVPIQALLEEREKRQQYERELKEFREQQDKAKKEAPKLPDYFENPDAYNAAIEQMVQERVTGLEQKVNQQMSQAWLSMSERAAKARYQDFDEKLEAFSLEAQTNPVLAAQMMQSPDPGDYVYQTGKKLMALSSTPDLDTLREQIRNELLAEMKQGEDAKKAKLAAVPKSLSREQSASGPRESEWQPTSLEDAIRRR